MHQLVFFIVAVCLVPTFHLFQQIEENGQDAYTLRKTMHEGFEVLEIAMPELEVAKTLGQPDRKEVDGEKEVWCYGVSF